MIYFSVYIHSLLLSNREKDKISFSNFQLCLEIYYQTGFVQNIILFDKTSLSFRCMISLLSYFDLLSVD